MSKSNMAKITASLVTILLLVTQQVHTDPLVPVSQNGEVSGRVKQAFVEGAITYEIQRYRRMDIALQLDTLYRLDKEGRSDLEIKEALEGIKRRFSRNPVTSGPNKLVREGAGALGAGIGSLTGFPVNAVIGGLYAKGLVDLYHKTHGKGMQMRIEQRHAQQLLGKGLKSVVQKGLPTCMKKEWCTNDFKQTFGTRVGPGDDMDSIDSLMPELAEYKTVLKIKDGQERTQQMIKQSKELIKRSQDELSKTIKAGQVETTQGIERIEDLLVADWQRERQREHIQKQAEIAQVKREGIQAAAFIASSVVGLVDADMGRQIGAVAQATFQISDAIQKFNASVKLVDGLSGFAGAALTGDLLSAGLLVIGAFIDTGPTADEVIISQIGEMREQIQALHQDMHDRFGRLEEQNAAIFRRLDEGFSTLQQQNEEMLKRLESIHVDLVKQSRALDSMQHLIISRSALILKHLHATEIEKCINWKKAFLTRMSEEEFIDCIGKIEALATGGFLDQLQFSKKDGDPANIINDHHDNSVRLAMNVMQDMLPQSSNALPNGIVGPVAWRTLAEANDVVIADWPEHAELVGGENYRKRMNEYRLEIIEAADAIAEEYARFELGEPSAFGTLFSELQENVKDLESLIENTLHKQMKAREKKMSGETTTLKANHPWDIAYLRPNDGNNPETLKRRITDWAWERTWPKNHHVECKLFENEMPPDWNRDYAKVKLEWYSGNNMDYLRSKTRNTLEGGNPGFVSMINMNMVRIDPCIVGWSQTMIAPEEENGYKLKKWELEQNVQILAQLMIEIDCESEKVIEEVFAEKYSIDNFAIHFQTGWRFSSVSVREILPADHNRRIKLRATIEEIMLELEDKNNGKMGVRNRACSEELERRYYREGKSISRAAIELISLNPKWDEIQKKFTDANIYITAWLRIAAADGLDLPVPATAILSKVAKIPTPASILKGNGQIRRPLLWEVPERLRKEIDLFKALLGHREISEWMNSRSGSFQLRNTAYLGID